MSTETKEEVNNLVDRFTGAHQDALVLGEKDSWHPAHERRYLDACKKADELKEAIKSQFTQLTLERDALRNACVVALDVLSDRYHAEDGPCGQQLRAALAMGNGRRSPSCDEREKMLRASLLSFVRVENSFGHTGQHKPNECADCKRVIQANEALGHGFLLSESALAMGKEKRR